MKKVAIILLLAGVVFIAAGGYKLIKTKHAQSNSMEQAEKLLDDNKNERPETTLTSSQPAEFNPAEGEAVGKLNIPTLESELPIVEGTDEDELEKGVGHYDGTAYPSQNNQIVLSGHRDTVFRRLGELELGDTLTVELPYGDFTYEISDTKIVDADNRSVISPTSPQEVLTVTTCYPFSYVGHAPDRYIITALPAENK